jgi:serine/threonine protein kinase/Tol biopolymer transport system component
VSSELARLAESLADRYRIEREIGAGGMATVHLALDVKHNRRVALKVLKPELGAVLGVERFLAEIQVTANLQHPNLLPLFDSGEADGLLFYVMPFVDGETLRARLDREKQLPVDEAVRIATAVASALAYAHDRGVIHRDLKPENVLLQAGQPVIADFGIALAVSNAGGSRVTQTGLSLGTPQYMSPEQATGNRAIDARSDIYSLGAMTYEMLVGDPPHLASTAQAIIAKVLTERPPSVSVARPAAGDVVSYAIERALEKLPADRWTSAAEFADALRGRLSTSATSTRTRALGGRASLSRRTRIAFGALAGVAVVGAASTAWLATRNPPSLRLGRFTIELPDSTIVGTDGPGSGNPLAISRDGSELVVAGHRMNGESQLYLRRIDDQSAQAIRGTAGAQQAAFSPDGQSVVYHSYPALKVVPLVGGTPRTITDSGATPHWGDNNQIVFTRGGHVWVVSPDGGQRRHVIGPDSATGRVRVAFPNILPGGTHALVTWWKGEAVIDSARLGVVSLADGAFTDLHLAGSHPRYVRSGYVVFGRAGNELHAAPFSVRSRTITGPAVLLLQNVWQNPGAQTGFAVSENGTLVFFGSEAGVSSHVRLCLVGRQGSNEQCLSAAPADYGEPRVSPDGKRIVVRTSSRPGMIGDIILYDIGAGTTTTLATGVTNARPEWSSDGARVVFQTTMPGDSMRVMSRRWDLSEPAQEIATGSAGQFEQLAPGPADTWVVFRRAARGSTGAITVLRTAVLTRTDSLSSGIQILGGRVPYQDARVSPNGRSVAFSSNEGRRREVYVTPLPGPGAPVPVSVNGGDQPMWSRDGTMLFYRSLTHMMAATIVERPALSVLRRDTLFDERGRFPRPGPTRYDVMPDGRFLMLRRDSSAAVDRASTSVTWIANWTRLRSRRRARDSRRA